MIGSHYGAGGCCARLAASPRERALGAAKRIQLVRSLVRVLLSGGARNAQCVVCACVKNSQLSQANRACACEFAATDRARTSNLLSSGGIGHLVMLADHVSRRS